MYMCLILIDNNEFEVHSLLVFCVRMWFLLYSVLFTSVYADPEFVTKKLCKDVDQNQCTIYSVVVDPCERGQVCSIKKNKKYGMTLNLMPKFSAQKLKLSITGDVQNDDTFSTVLQPPKNGCGLLSCPLQAEERRIFDVDLVLNKKASGKFPVKVKLWNEEDESQACCFTFTVKTK